MTNETASAPEASKHRDIKFRWFLLFLVGALLVWGLFWFAMALVIPKWREYPQFDMFSAAGALFSALAFGGLIYTILLQRRDLGLQLEELQQTREELRGQKDQLAAQNATFQRQSFETRFFEWLKLHHEIVNAIHYEGLFGPGSSRGAFVKFMDEMRSHYVQLLRQATPEQERNPHRGESNASYVHRLHVQPGLSPKDVAIKTYGEVFQTIQGQVGHYFRNLYNLVKFVDASDLKQREKRFYTNIIRAQLSSYELTLLFYNCISPVGAKFKPLCLSS